MKTKKIGSIFSAAVLSLSSLLTMGFMPAAHAATPCDLSGEGNYSNVVTRLTGGSGIIADTVQKAGMEYTPVSSPESGAVGISENLYLAKTDCTDAQVYLRANIDSNGKLTVTVDDRNHATAYSQSTDFKNAASGVQWSSTSNTSAQFTYTLPGFAVNTPELVSFSIANAGWADVSLKEGSGTESLLGSMAIDSSAVKYENYNSKGMTFIYSPAAVAQTSCSKITKTYEVKLRTFYDGSLTTMSENKSSLCPSQDASAFNASTNTLDVKLLSASSVSSVSHHFIAPSHVAMLWGMLNDFGSYDSKNASFGNTFINSTSSSQQVALAGWYLNKASNGYVINQEFPVALGVFDMSKSDVDGSMITGDSSKTAYTAFVHGFADLTKDKTFTLYVPYRTGDNFVGICSGVTKLSAVTNKCTGVYYLKDGQSKTSKDTKSITAGVTVTAKVVTIGGSKYWQVSGLTGTGGFSTKLASDPDTGFAMASSNPTTTLAITAVLGLGILGMSRKLGRR